MAMAVGYPDPNCLTNNYYTIIQFLKIPNKHHHNTQANRHFQLDYPALDVSYCYFLPALESLVPVQDRQFLAKRSRLIRKHIYNLNVIVVYSYILHNPITKCEFP
jgi:hypothetical protein